MLFSKTSLWYLKDCRIWPMILHQWLCLSTLSTVIIMEEEISSHIPTLLIESHSFTHSVRAYSMSGSEWGARHVRQTKYSSFSHGNFYNKHNNTNKCININCDKFHKKIREAFEKTVSVQFSCSVMRQFKGYNLAVRSKRRPLWRSNI